MKRSTVPASTASGAGVGAGPGAGGVKKTGVQANGHAAAAARRKRDLEVAGYIDMLPLEYRGQDPVCLSFSFGIRGSEILPGAREAALEPSGWRAIWVMDTDRQNMRLGMEKVIKKLLVTPDGCSSKYFCHPLLCMGEASCKLHASSHE